MAFAHRQVTLYRERPILSSFCHKTKQLCSSNVSTRMISKKAWLGLGGSRCLLWVVTDFEIGSHGISGLPGTCHVDLPVPTLGLVTCTTTPVPVTNLTMIKRTEPGRKETRGWRGSSVVWSTGYFCRGPAPTTTAAHNYL